MDSQKGGDIFVYRLGDDEDGCGDYAFDNLR